MVVSLALLPQMLGLTYDQVALASGDSRGFFTLNASRAAILVTLLLVLVPMLGVFGAPLAMASTALLTYPLQLRLARKHGAWDAVHDGVMALMALALAAVVLTIHGESLSSALSL
jgi:hypothetical protein